MGLQDKLRGHREEKLKAEEKGGEAAAPSTPTEE